MLGNQVELWETMLAAMKLGAVVIPATTLLAESDLRDRIERGNAQHVVVRAADAAKFDGVPGDYTRIAVGGARPTAGSTTRCAYEAPAEFVPDGADTRDRPAAAVLHLGTTARPKLVEHTHASYPVGHLSTMYWLGLQPGDVHLNISSPGLGQARLVELLRALERRGHGRVFNYARFDAAALLDVIADHGVTTFCAPPTVWRMLIQADLALGARRRCARSSAPASR